MGYSHQNSKGKTYFLHSKDVVLKGGRNQTIYYFAKEAKAGACDLPAGKTVVENTKTGLPFLKGCLLYTSPSPRDMRRSRMPSSA